MDGRPTRIRLGLIIELLSLGQQPSYRCTHVRSLSLSFSLSSILFYWGDKFKIILFMAFIALRLFNWKPYWCRRGLLHLQPCVMIIIKLSTTLCFSFPPLRRPLRLEAPQRTHKHSQINKQRGKLADLASSPLEYLSAASNTCHVSLECLHVIIYKRF